MPLRLPLLVTAAVTFLPLVAGAATLHVDDSSSAPGQDGSAAAPYRSLQAAVDAAKTGDTLLVAAGSYGPVEIAGKSLTLLGGFAGGSADGFAARAPGQHVTTVSGSGTAIALALSNAGTTTVDGFVITHGVPHGIAAEGDGPERNAVTIRGNLIADNGVPAQNGGGVYANNCSLVLEGNTIRDNHAERGAGVTAYCDTLRMRGNLVERNVGHSDHGGGVYLNGSDVLVTGNLIRGNRIGEDVGYGWGGGLLVYGDNTRATLRGNEYVGNEAPSVGSAVFVDDGAVVTLEHELVHHNACSKSGGAIYVDGFDQLGSRATLRHVTIADNSCASGGVGEASALYVERASTVTVDSSLFWRNGGVDVETDGSATVQFTYSLGEDPHAGTGNLAGVDPRFADASGGDYHLVSTVGRFDPRTREWVTDPLSSPAIDVGNPASDASGEPGPNGGRVNIGHHGGTAEASMGGPGGEPPADAGPAPDANPFEDAAPVPGRDGGNPPQGDGGAGDDPGDDGDNGVDDATAEGGCGCRVGAHDTTIRPWMALLGLLWLVSRRRRT